MGKKILFGLVALATFIAILFYVAKDASFPVLQPKGQIGQQELDILLFAAALSLIVVIPVFVLTIFIVWKYQASNTKATYSPNWDHGKKLELVWWVVPIILIAILSVVTWKTSHSLDPFKPLDSNKEPLTIQVVALQWRWLFIYPEQNIASINLAQFPVDRPVRFQITSDAPMNAFWIPQLGGQIYAMSGMSTEINLEAHTAGDYKGLSSNISGAGFANMRFIARAGSGTEFANWVEQAGTAKNRLSVATYEELAQPSQDTANVLFSSVDDNLYDTIVMKYMMHADTNKSHTMEMGH